MSLMLFGSVGPWEIIIVLFLAVLIFGGKRLPQLGAGLGEGIRNFKKSVTSSDENEQAATDSKRSD